MNNAQLTFEQATELLKLSKQLEDIVDYDISNSSNWSGIFVSSYMRVLSISLLGSLQDKKLKGVDSIRKQCIKSFSKVVKRRVKPTDITSALEAKLGKVDDIFVEAINKDFEQLGL